MTLTQIEYFVEVASCLNFTEAAGRLFVSQQVVSQQIQKLEKELDIQLLERTTKRVRLTHSGMILYRTWREFLSRHESAIRAAVAAHNRQHNRLHIGIADISSVVDYMQPRIADYVQRNPQVEMGFSFQTFKQLEEALDRQETDAVITLVSELDAGIPHLQVRPLYEASLGIVISRNHPLGEVEHLRVRDLQYETFYFFSDKHSNVAEQLILEHCRHEGFQPAHMEYFDNAQSMELALYTGKGVTIAYEMFFRNRHHQLRFHPVEVLFGPHHQQVVVAWHDTRNPLVESFVECLQDAAD